MEQPRAVTAGLYERGELYCPGGYNGLGYAQRHTVKPDEANKKGAGRLFCPVHNRQLRVRARTQKSRRERQARFAI